MVALQVQGFCLILAIFPAPIIPRIGFYGLKYKAFSIIQDTLVIENDSHIFNNQSESLLPLTDHD
jgi:hypothetical protein